MATAIKSITIIGSGNIAFQLGKAFAGHVRINSIYSRNFETGRQLAEELHAYQAHTLSEIIPSDLILVCVNDDEINTIVSELDSDHCVAYTSGSVGLLELTARQNLGVLYPLQTFSRDREVNLFEVPFFIEATNTVFAQSLFDLAWLVSRKVVYANSRDRKNLHVAAVMVNNFVNHIDYLAQEFLKANSMEWEYLKPLIKETAMKLQTSTPFVSQTGPAVRGDEKTIASHMDLLDDDTREIYKILSDSITKHHKA